MTDISHLLPNPGFFKRACDYLIKRPVILILAVGPPLLTIRAPEAIAGAAVTVAGAAAVVAGAVAVVVRNVRLDAAALPVMAAGAAVKLGAVVGARAGTAAEAALALLTLGLGTVGAVVAGPRAAERSNLISTAVAASGLIIASTFLNGGDLILGGSLGVATLFSTFMMHRLVVVLNR
jgi:hypothetical protein